MLNTMKHKWEYLTESFNAAEEGYDARMNEYGKEGWELVGVLKSPSNNEGVFLGFFKRPKQEEKGKPRITGL